MTDIRSALEAARKALEPFAKAGELFGPRADGEYDLCVYKPAAGKEYEIVGDDLRRTGPALAQIDAALASLDAPQPDALREAGEALEPFDFYDFAPEDGWSDTDELEVHAPDGILLHCLKVGDIRRARSALRKAGGSND